MQIQKNLADFKTYGMTQLYIISMRLKMFTLKLIRHENTVQKRNNVKWNNNFRKRTHEGKTINASM